MAAHSNSVALQLFSLGSVARLRKQIGRVVPSRCSCSTTAPSPSTDASVINWNGRFPEIAAGKSGKAKTLGLDSCYIKVCTI